MTTFQAIVMGAFVVFLLGGVAAFALFKGGGEGKLPQIVMWGTLPELTVYNLTQMETLKTAGVTIDYVEKDPATFEADFVEALASGNSPDLVMFPHDLLYRQKNKLYTIPFNIISERSFKDSFVEGGEVFLTPNGVIGLPFLADPMVMYWNRSLFSSKAIATAPKYWDEFFTLAPKFNEKNDAGNLRKTVVALGETVNITHFKELLSALIIQAGNPIVQISPQVGPTSVLNENFGYDNSPTEAALRFYTEFSNPVKPAYSWNKSQLDSKDAFVAEDLGTYFGLASELSDIRARNPNLNFDVAVIPQIRDAERRVTFGRVYGLVIPKNARNGGAAISVAQILTSTAALRDLSQLIDLPPMRRDLLSVPPSNPYSAVFYSSAIMSRAWLDPSPRDTLPIFQDMVENIISGKNRISEAISRADRELDSIIRNYASQ